MGKHTKWTTGHLRGRKKRRQKLFVTSTQAHDCQKKKKAKEKQEKE